MTLDRLLHEIIPYRMHAVSTLNLAICLQMEADKRRAMEIYVEGKLRIEGNLFAFTNPAIEAGLVHCRALLEFLGLTTNRIGRIVNIKGRRPSDMGIENFSDASGPLPMVSPDAALARYHGGKEDAERALLAVFQVTNKGIAHVTEDLKDNPDHGRLIEIASRGVPSLLVSYLYTPLKLPAPDYTVLALARHS